MNMNLVGYFLLMGFGILSAIHRPWNRWTSVFVGLALAFLIMDLANLIQV